MNVAPTQPGTRRQIHTKDWSRAFVQASREKPSQSIEKQAAGDAVTSWVAANTTNAWICGSHLGSCDWLCWLQSPSRVQPYCRSSVLVCPSRVAVTGPSKMVDLSAHVRTSHSEYGPGPSPSPSPGMLCCEPLQRAKTEAAAFGTETHCVQQSQLKKQENPCQML